MHLNRPRVVYSLEQRQYKNDIVWSATKLILEIAPLFHSPLRWANKRVNFKINFVIDQIGRSYFAFALNQFLGPYFELLKRHK